MRDLARFAAVGAAKPSRPQLPAPRAPGTPSREMARRKLVEPAAKVQQHLGRDLTPAGLQIQAALSEMERNLLRQRVLEGVKAARAYGRKGDRPRILTAEKLRYAQRLMADRTRSIPAICRELSDVPMSTLYHFLAADGTLKAPGRWRLGRTHASIPTSSAPTFRRNHE